MTSVRIATLYSLGQRYFSFIVQLASSMVVARLLTPAEIGVFSLAAAMIAVAQLLRDFGVGEYVTQERQMTLAKQQTVFGASILVAWFLAALLAAVAPWLAQFYGQDGLRPVLYVLALNFVLLPIGATAFAMLTRELEFKRLFLVHASAALVSASLAVGLAWRGYSYLSLAWAAVAGNVTSIVLLALLRPGQTFLRPRLTGIGAVARFGGLLTFGRLVDQFARRAPDLLIPQTLGFHALGINSKATTLLDSFHDFFGSGINRVATPAFAGKRHAEADVRAAYLDALAKLSLAPFAFFLLLGLLAEPLLRVMFGPQWTPAATVVQIGALGGFFAGPFMLAPSLLTAHGRVRDILKIQLWGSGAFLLMVLPAVGHSLEAVAAAAVLAAFVKFAWMQVGVRRCLGVRALDRLRAVRKSLLLALLAFAAALPGSLLNDGSLAGALASVLTSALGAGLTLVAGIFAFGHPLVDELRRAGRQWRARRA